MLLHHSIPTNLMEAMNITVVTTIFAAEEDAGLNAEEIGKVAVVVRKTVILHINVGLTECVTIQEFTAGSRHKATIRTQFGLTRCREENVTAPDRLGRYLQ